MASTPSNNFDFQNYYSATLQSDITPTSLSLSLDVVPTPVEGILVIEPDSTTNREIIFYTGKTSSTITLPADGRGWDGTVATTHLSGSTIIMAPVAYMLRMLKSGSLYDTTKTGWTGLGQALTFVQNNGQKEQVLASSSDLTGTLTPGMKMKFDRPAGTPTQSMAFTAASSQYASKTSPAGITFTAAFTCEAWIYVNSYATEYIIARGDSPFQNGFFLRLNASGQLEVGYASANTGTTQTSYQSIPLKQWVHVAGVVSSVSSKTVATYINGVLVPSSTTATGATALTQAGNLALATQGSSLGSYFDGYISEARVWSVAQSQASIQSNMAISLIGSETNLVALFQGNGNFNDKTTNANNLTATNGAIATQASNPYNSTEYGIVTNVTSSQVTLFTGTNYNVPSTGTLANFYYSTSRNPYNFPGDRSLWSVSTLIKTRPTSTSITSANTWYETGTARLVVPTGAWKIEHTGSSEIVNGTSAINIDGRIRISNVTPTGDDGLPATAYIYSNGYSTQYYVVPLHLRYPTSVINTSQSTFNVYVRLSAVSGSTFTILGDVSTWIYSAECAYI